ncbi:hypothetical protein ABPG73_011225 [Tetrahymena malaccensis]
MNRHSLKKLDNKYVVDESKLLGSGNCGSVYFGWKTDNTEQYLAIKQIPINSKFEITDSMLIEINLLRRLDHPNIVKFIDAKKTKDFMYLIMEFCNEGSIEDLILSQKVPENEVLDYFKQICKAFRELNNKNILHGDVKPSNILLHNSQCKLADFGVSKTIDKKSENTTMRGTPFFMAPQLLNNQPYTTKSDIWSLGITLFFMLFKRLPWEEKVQKQHQLRQFITNEYDPDKFFSQCTNVISDFTLNLLKRMIVVDEEKRISWEELFKLVIPSDDLDEQIYKDKSINESFSFQNSQYFDQITRQTVDFKKGDNDLDISTNTENDQELQNQADNVFQKYYYKNEQTIKAKEAKNQLELEIQKAEFFKNVAKQIEQHREIIEKFPGGLFSQCMFLLRKRCYIHLVNLQQMVSFNTHKSGNIEIDEESFESFFKLPDWQHQVKIFQNQIFQKSTEIKKLFQKSKDELEYAFQNLPDFNQTLRGNAYDEKHLEENESLILAFNDNLIQLFKLLTERIFEEKKKGATLLTKQLIQQQTGIDIHLVYDLISCIVFRQDFKQQEANIKLSQYYEEKRKCDTEELMFRIEIAYNEWIILKNYPTN